MNDLLTRGEDRQDRSAIAEPSRPMLWALADQAVVSGGNFLTNVVVARLASPAVYGGFALCFAAILALNSLHSALVVYPLSIGISKEALPMRQASIVTCALLITVAAIGILATCLVPILSHFIGLQVSFFALCAMCAWQAQETCRRALMATLNFRAALLGDFVSYPVQAILIFLVGQRGHQLSLPAILAWMLATSLAATLIQLIQIKPALSARDFFVNVRGFWQLGRWGIAAALLSMTYGPAYFAVLGFRFGSPSVAALQSMGNVLNPTQPVMSAVSSAVLPSVAHTHKETGSRAASRAGMKIGLYGALLVTPYLLALFCFPTAGLTFVYGEHSPYNSLGGPLRLFCCGYLLLYAGNLLSGILNALGHPRSSFYGHRVAAVLSIAIGLPLAALLGPEGAAAGFLLASGGRVASQLVSLNRVVREPEAIKC